MLTTGGSLDAATLGSIGASACVDAVAAVSDAATRRDALPLRETSATTKNTRPTAASAPPAPTARAHVGFRDIDPVVFGAHGALKPAGGLLPERGPLDGPPGFVVCIDEPDDVNAGGRSLGRTTGSAFVASGSDGGPAPYGEGRRSEPFSSPGSAC